MTGALGRGDTVSRVTGSGTTIWVTTRQVTGDRVVVLENPHAPEGMRHLEAGRIIDHGFQPSPEADFALTADALRIIADLMDQDT